MGEKPKLKKANAGHYEVRLGGELPGTVVHVADGWRAKGTDGVTKTWEPTRREAALYLVWLRGITGKPAPKPRTKDEIRALLERAPLAMYESDDEYIAFRDGAMWAIGDLSDADIGLKREEP